MRYAPFAIALAPALEVLAHGLARLVGPTLADRLEDALMLGLDDIEEQGFVLVIGKACPQGATRNQALAHFIDKEAEARIVGGIGNGTVKRPIGVGGEA